MPAFDLVISGLDMPPYSIRGVTQTLAPIEATMQLARTVNGALLDLSPPQMRKYQSTIECSDQQPPAVDKVWPGALITVDCVVELAYKTAGGSPGRPVVSSRVDGAFTIYRPRLTMRVVQFSINKDEWGAVVSWSILAEEV